MIQIFTTLLTFVLIVISVLLVFIILMQRSGGSGGLGTAFGSGLAESAFGTETGNILSRLTHIFAGIFFVASLILYLLYMIRIGEQGEEAPLPEAMASETLPLPEEATAQQPAPGIPESLPSAEAPAPGFPESSAPEETPPAAEQPPENKPAP